MEYKQNERQRKRQIERVILLIYSFYSVVLAIVSVLLRWHKVVPQFIAVGMILCWIVFVKRYRSYRFRAFLTTCVAWIEFVIFGINADDFTIIFSMMCAMIVLFSVYCIPEVVYLSVLAYSFLLVYHGLVAGNIRMNTAEDAASLMIQIMTVFMTEYVSYYLTIKQQESNEKIWESIETLERAEKSKDDFMANVSHEIRTPINTISGMSEMILKEELPDTIREDVFDIQAAGRNLLSVVSDILDFTELQSGKMELIEEPYNITSTINDVMNMAIAKKGDKPLEIIVDCDSSLPCSLLGDEQKIRRAIINIVDNAIKFTNEGGIVIAAGMRKEEYGINLIVTVKDTGIGMDEETIEKLFTTFNQVDTRRNRQEGGIGLGLAITKAIISKMGGFITVKSEYGKGSEIQFVIPQKVLDEAPIVTVEHPEDIRVAFYIDMDKYDYELIRDSYAMMIQNLVTKLGVYCHKCMNLAEMKRRVEKEKFTHLFISWQEYCEDKQYFDRVSGTEKVVLIKEHEDEEEVPADIITIYKPFYALSVAAAINGQRILQSMDGSHYQSMRFVAPEVNVLVVDDNVMNLKVVEGLLRPYKIKVFVAGSGKEALQKIESMAYDFVFMDHMMPEMDGVETLHNIRNKPGRYFREVPIIALTANAIGGAREMFLSEGFSDFVAKPIQTSVLERVLKRFIPENKMIKVEEEQQHLKEETHTQEQRDDKESLLKMDDIDVKLGLTYCGGQVEDYVDVVRLYYTTGLSKTKEMDKLCEKKDWKNYTILAHSLKAMSMGIGATKLSDMAQGLEAAGNAQDENYILSHHDKTQREYKRILMLIEGNDYIFSGLKAESGTEHAKKGRKEITKKDLLDRIEELQGKIDCFEQESVFEILEELAEYEIQGEQLIGMFAPVKENIEQFDFMGAQEELATIAERMR